MLLMYELLTIIIITKCNFHKKICLLSFTQRTYHPVNLRFICHRFASSPCLLVANDGKQTNKKFFLWQLRTNSCSKFRFHSFRVMELFQSLFHFGFLWNVNWLKVHWFVGTIFRRRTSYDENVIFLDPKSPHTFVKSPGIEVPHVKARRYVHPSLEVRGMHHFDVEYK